MDYYQILNLSKSNNPSKDDIRKAYRKAAMTWHPDKWANKSDKEKKTAEKKFKEINNAHNVLSDPNKKSKYDRFGEEGLRGSGNAQHFPGGFQFFFRNNGMKSPFFHQSFHHQTRNSNNFVQIKQVNLILSLNELYTGCQKNMKISDKNIEKIVTINVKPGWKEGTKITFNLNNYKFVFIIKEKKHTYYEREGDNLIWNCKLSKQQLLKDLKITLPSLKEGKFIFMLKSGEGIINRQKVLSNRGMPILNTDKFGDLIVCISIL
jgi:DnaJ-class molecular chaperone